MVYNSILIVLFRKIFFLLLVSISGGASQSTGGGGECSDIFLIKKPKFAIFWGCNIILVSNGGKFPDFVEQKPSLRYSLVNVSDDDFSIGITAINYLNKIIIIKIIIILIFMMYFIYIYLKYYMNHLIE